MRLLSSFVISLASLQYGCTTLPDVTTFAEADAGLATSAGRHYRAAAAIEVKQLPHEPDDALDARSDGIQNAQKIFAETEEKLNELFSVMTACSEKLASLVLTKIQAQKCLKDAVLVADPGVQVLAAQVEVIYLMPSSCRPIAYATSH